MAKARSISRAAYVATVSSLILAGCTSLRPTQKAFAPDEYDQRHPIVLGQATTHLDVFGMGSRLDARQYRDIVNFAKDYARNGRGGIVAAIPRSHGGASPQNMAAIRQALYEGGAGMALQMTGYEADARLGSAPVRLSFSKLQAKVASQCGLWPADLAGGKEAETWHNRPYHNLGCSYQTMLAAQIADPLDLVRPRAESPIDVGKRTKDIEELRKGNDPSTKWAKDDAKVADVAGK